MLISLFWIIVGVVYIATKVIKIDAIPTKERAYMAARGFNTARQYALERMPTSTDPAKRMEFARLCGYTPHGEWEERMAVREISIREGWRYYDTAEVHDDPQYVKIIGGKYPKWLPPGTMAQKWKSVEDRARQHIAEVDRRKAWIERCPHGEEFDIFPMDYETEEDYQDAVEARYLKKEKERVREEKERHYRKYATYREAYLKDSTAGLIDEAENKWSNIVNEIGWTPLNTAIAMYGEYAVHLFRREYLPILKDKCSLEGVDWDAVVNFWETRKNQLTDPELEASIMAFISDAENRDKVNKEIGKALKGMKSERNVIGDGDKLIIMLANRGKIKQSMFKEGVECWPDGHPLQKELHKLMVWVKNTLNKQGVDAVLQVQKCKSGSQRDFVLQTTYADRSANQDWECKDVDDDYKISIPKAYYDK